MDKLKAFGLELYYFFTSRVFFKHLALMTGLSVILGFLLFWGMGRYTLQGDSVSVPDLRKQSLQRAKDLLSASDLRLVVSDSSYDDKLPAMSIIEQTPKPGSSVKRSRTIYVKINQQNPPEMSLYYQDIIGHPLPTVKRKLAEGMKLKLNVKYTAGRAKNTVAQLSYKGKVIFRDIEDSRSRPPKEAVKIPQGATVDLLVYQGGDAENKTVPDMLCQTFGKAEGIIRMNKFNLGQVQLGPNIRDTLAAFVRRQDPVGGEQISMGGAINIWLVAEKPAGCED